MITCHPNPEEAVSRITLKQVIFLENGYGGVYAGAGGYSCTDPSHSCEKPMVEFILTPPGPD